MSYDHMATFLINNRIAILDRRKSQREKLRNEGRVGLSEAPTPKQINEYDKTKMGEIRETLLHGHAGNVSVTQLRTLKHFLLHPQGLESFMKDKRVVTGLIGELTGKRPMHKLQAAYICVNLGQAKETDCLWVCRAGGPYLVKFIEGCSYYLQEASAWAIGNLAGASENCAGVLKAQGAVPQLIKLLSRPDKGLCLAAAYALSHIIHSKIVPEEDEMIQLAEIVSSLLPSTEPDICTLLYLLSCFPICEKTFIDNKVATKSMGLLVEFASETFDKSPKTVTALMRTIGNLSPGLGGVELINKQETECFFKNISRTSYKHIGKEARWICANLLSHENEAVRAYTARSLLPLVLGS